MSGRDLSTVSKLPAQHNLKARKSLQPLPLAFIVRLVVIGPEHGVSVFNTKGTFIIVGRSGEH